MSDSAQNAQGEADAFDELVLSRHLETARSTETQDTFVINQQVSGKKSYGKSRVHTNIEEINPAVTSGNVVDSDDDVDLDAYVNNKSSKVFIILTDNFSLIYPLIYLLINSLPTIIKMTLLLMIIHTKLQ